MSGYLDHNIVCLWFPYLSVETTFKNESEFKKSPFSTTSNHKKKQTLYSINSFGELLGLKSGISLYEAHMLCPNLRAKKRNCKRETSFLNIQAKWCYQFTPRVSIDKEDALILDIKGCTHLFGSTRKVIKKIHAHFESIDITLFSSIAGTPTIAKSLAKFNFYNVASDSYGEKIFHSENQSLNARNIKTDKNNFETLNTAVSENNPSFEKISIRELNLHPTENNEMKYLGITTIDDLSNIPHRALLVRFGPKIIKKLMQITRVEPELIEYWKPQKKISSSLRVPEPIKFTSNIQNLIEKLIRSVCDKLKLYHKRTRHLILNLYETNNDKQSLQIQTSEYTSDSQKFIQLLNQKIISVKTEFGIDRIRVCAIRIEDVLPKQGHLNFKVFQNENSPEAIVKKPEYKDLISKLANKLGSNNLIYFHPNESHIPEKNAIKVSAFYSSPTPYWPKPKFRRPTLILKPEPVKIIEQKEIPILFTWRQKNYIVKTFFGPERISPEWWFDNPLWRTGLRDYWKIEGICGIRLWIFEAKGAELKGGWFIHGIFV